MATNVADQIRTFKGTKVLVTKTGETKLPDGFMYLLDLVSDSTSVVCNKLLSMSTTKNESLSKLSKLLEPTV